MFPYVVPTAIASRPLPKPVRTFPFAVAWKFLCKRKLPSTRQPQIDPPLTATYKGSTFVLRRKDDKDDNERTKQAVRDANDCQRGREKCAEFIKSDASYCATQSASCQVRRFVPSPPAPYRSDLIFIPALPPVPWPCIRRQNFASLYVTAAMARRSAS
jgi:hypothetical protein